MRCCCPVVLACLPVALPGPLEVPGPPSGQPSACLFALFARYSPGQRFGKHIDESQDLPGGRFTGYTLLVYLSTPNGGETVFYGEHLPAGLLLPSPSCCASRAPASQPTCKHSCCSPCKRHAPWYVPPGCEEALVHRPLPSLRSGQVLWRLYPGSLCDEFAAASNSIAAAYCNALPPAA